MEKTKAEELIKELHRRICSHMREHISIVSKEGWEAGSFKSNYGDK